VLTAPGFRAQKPLNKLRTAADLVREKLLKLLKLLPLKKQGLISGFNRKELERLLSGA
jgi:hypothetical protein